MLIRSHDRSGAGRWDPTFGAGIAEIDPASDLGSDVRHLHEPERRLLFAILSDAIVRYRQLAAAPGHAQHELREAERWIRSDDRSWPCSFVNVCEALDIAWEPLRRAVLKWRRPADDRRRVTRRGLLVKKRRRSRAAEPARVHAESTDRVHTAAPGRVSAAGPARVRAEESTAARIDEPAAACAG